MFESIPPPSLSARLRGAAIPPIAAFVLTHVYFSLSLSLQFRFRFWIAGVILAVGAAAGLVQIVRIVRGGPVRGVALGWLILAAVAVVLCAQTLYAIVFPPR